jgi:hypothetical protein
LGLLRIFGGAQSIGKTGVFGSVHLTLVAQNKRLLTDAALEAMLFARAGIAPGTRRKAEPDWPVIHRELRRPGVTLKLVWQEYRAAEPEGLRLLALLRALSRLGKPAVARRLLDVFGSVGFDLIIARRKGFSFSVYSPRATRRYGDVFSRRELLRMAPTVVAGVAPTERRKPLDKMRSAISA